MTTRDASPERRIVRFEALRREGHEEARVLVRAGKAGTLHVRISVPFELPDAGSVVVQRPDGQPEVRHYAGDRSCWREVEGVNVPDSGLIRRFEGALRRVMADYPGYHACGHIWFDFSGHEGQRWGQTESPTYARCADVFGLLGAREARFPIIDRAMRCQRLTSRRLGVPCEYEELARIAVRFDLTPPV